MRAVRSPTREGHFAIERVTPGEARVHWQADSVEQSRPPDRYYLAPFVAVEPGKTAHVELVLEGGLPLVGRVAVAADGGPSLEDMKWDAFLAPKLPEPPFPAGLPRKDRDSWLNRWSLSEAGKEYRRLQRNFGHTLRLKPDRSFRVDEIQPGSIPARREGPRDPAGVEGRLRARARQADPRFHRPRAGPRREGRAGRPRDAVLGATRRCSAPAIPLLASRSRRWMGRP